MVESTKASAMAEASCCPASFLDGVVLDVLCAGFRSASFAVRRARFVHRVSKHHRAALQVSDGDTRLLVGMPVPHDDFLRRARLLRLGRARDLVVSVFLVANDR